MADVELSEAVGLALHAEMRRDPAVVALGEALGRASRGTAGLREAFGEARAIRTPLAEPLIVAMAIGMATQGLRPVAEIRPAGSAYACLDQLAQHAARYRQRTLGRLSCPMVLRLPCGGGSVAEPQAELLEAAFVRTPGLRVVCPSTPARAYGLLLAAIRDADPVVFLEPAQACRQRQPLIDDGAALPLDTAFVERPGRDLTLVAWGSMLGEARLAAERLDEEGVSVELIDLAALRPLDMRTILGSVARTGRCVVVQDAPRGGGLAGEILAGVAESGLPLRAPPLRVAAADTVPPLAGARPPYRPDAARLVREIRARLALA